MQLPTFLKKTIGVVSILAIIVVVFLFGLSYAIKRSTAAVIYSDLKQIPKAHTVIVLGASVRADGNLSTMLKERVENALQLYKSGKVKRILVSGDNGTVNYNEPQAMKKYLLERGVPAAHIYMDYAGFDTFDSIFRASEIFEVPSAIIVTQQFHLPRALYIAQKLQLKAYGFVDDQQEYEHLKSNENRELLANVKAFLEVNFNQTPTVLGSKIPVTGPPQASYKTD